MTDSASRKPQTAFITGGASGIGRALSNHLVSKGWHIFIADRTDASTFTQSLNTPAGSSVAHYAETDVSSWSSQLSAFQKAITIFGGRIDFVAPIAGIGERKWIPSPEECRAIGEGEFAEPDLSVVEVDLKGPMYTIALAVQQFRRQEARSSWSGDGGKGNWRGKIAVVASVCGIYTVPSVPIYTAAKHGVVGLVRSYGNLICEEGISLNAVCPNLVKTGISTGDFYEKVGKEGLLVPMENLMNAFDDILNGSESAGIYECGLEGGEYGKGWVKKEGYKWLGEKSQRSMEMVEGRSRKLHYPLGQ